MKILVAAFVYNEIKYIEPMITYYRNQGCDIFILDNMSTDGTYEWLVKNGVDVERVDTKESFDLRILQSELVKGIKKRKPDWYVYTGADLYYSFDKKINEVIEEADRDGYDSLLVRCFGGLNTGEKYELPLHENYFIASYWRDLVMIAKYSDDITLSGDKVVMKEYRMYKPNGLMINYGACKPAKEQEEKLKRRTKAWNNGLKKGVGRHYRTGKQRNWIYSKSEGVDLRRTEDFKYIQNIINASRNN